MEEVSDFIDIYGTDRIYIPRIINSILLRLRQIADYFRALFRTKVHVDYNSYYFDT